MIKNYFILHRTTRMDSIEKGPLKKWVLLETRSTYQFQNSVISSLLHCFLSVPQSPFWEEVATSSVGIPGGRYVQGVGMSGACISGVGRSPGGGYV